MRLNPHGSILVADHRECLGSHLFDPGGDFLVKLLDASINPRPIRLLMRLFPNL